MSSPKHSSEHVTPKNVSDDVEETNLPGYIPPGENETNADSDSQILGATCLTEKATSKPTTPTPAAIPLPAPPIEPPRHSLLCDNTSLSQTNCSATRVVRSSPSTMTILVGEEPQIITTTPLSATLANATIVSTAISQGECYQQIQDNASNLTLSQKATIGSLSLVSVGSCVCRICHTSGRESLVSPCHCKGSLAYVHRSCLERWLTQAGLGHCEVCLYRYNVQMTRRYGFWEALRLWTRLPRNRGLLQSDLLICTLFTVVTLGLITVFLVGARLFVLGGLKLGISRVWTHGAISFSLSVLIIAYIINLYLIAKGQFGPWWIWWRSNVNVRLILEGDPSYNYIANRPMQDVTHV